MTFDDWVRQNTLVSTANRRQPESSRDAWIRVWNAAIDEAVKSVANRAASLERGHNPSLIIRDIKKLKQI